MENICVIFTSYKSYDVKWNSFECKKSIEFIHHSDIGDKKSLRLGKGVTIEHNDKTYILTCYHCIENYDKITIAYRKKQYTSFKPIYSMPEYDAVLLGSDTENLDSSFTLDDFCTDLTKVSTLNIFSKIFIKKKTPTIKQLMLKTKLYKLHKDNLISPYAPPLILLSCLIEDVEDILEENDIKLMGLSGSPVFSNNKLVGILSSYCNGQMLITHISTFKLLLNKKSINIIPFDYSVCKIESTYGLIVKNNYGISNLHINDVIHKINGLELNKYGLIKCKELNIYTDIHTFMCLDKMKNVNFSVMRKKKGYVNVEITNELYDFNSLAIIPSNDCHDYLIYNGFVFTELSRETLLKYSMEGIKLMGECMEHVENPYDIEGKKYIYVVTLIKSKFKNKKLQKLNKDGLPIKHINDDTFSLPILKKINNKKINNLVHMRKFLSENKVKSMTFKMNETLNIKF